MLLGCGSTFFIRCLKVYLYNVFHPSTGTSSGTNEIQIQNVILHFAECSILECECECKVRCSSPFVFSLKWMTCRNPITVFLWCRSLSVSRRSGFVKKWFSVFFHFIRNSLKSVCSLWVRIECPKVEWPKDQGNKIIRTWLG